MGVKRGAIFPPSCLQDCGSSGSCPGPRRCRSANGPGAAGFVKISVLLQMMAKPCARQEAYPPKTCNTAHVRYIKIESYSAELRIGSVKSRFSYYEEYVYPEGVTSGDNIPSFGNESVETSFH